MPEKGSGPKFQGYNRQNRQNTSNWTEKRQKTRFLLPEINKKFQNYVHIKIFGPESTQFRPFYAKRSIWYVELGVDSSESSKTAKLAKKRQKRKFLLRKVDRTFYNHMQVECIMTEIMCSDFIYDKE